ncbi:STAS domain-containing protein [Pontibacter sp. 13R65]|uniref:STAS domain-containing protein n=1 Tax=Pontibacter sp. 13R65 TaxID=3127458 RepID=UPI00301D980B
MKQFNIVTSYLDGGIILSLSGELDACSSVVADRAMEAAMNAGQKLLLVDFQDLHYISSAGIGFFLANLHMSQKQNIALILYGMQPTIRNIFEVVGLQKIFLLAESLEDALMLVHDA